MTRLSWRIPKKIIDNTSRALTSRQLEVFVLWTAPIETKNNVCEIKRLIVPRQDADVGSLGAYVHIASKELSRIVFDNYRHGERSVVQIHTHPSHNVDMSVLDRKWEVISHVGALSIIVPNYGKASLNDFLGVNIYEREENDWRLWDADEFKSRFEII